MSRYYARLSLENPNGDIKTTAAEVDKTAARNLASDNDSLARKTK
jgi:hypothetical protein